ncbi:MAG: sel1 repeat family protein [Candidatus Riflebacteria bacterium]|nr:sel1 repeat family protein [Candidatus Riflebacteria bacterium]
MLAIFVEYLFRVLIIRSNFDKIAFTISSQKGSFAQKMINQTREKLKSSLLDIVALKDPSVFKDSEKFAKLMLERTNLGFTLEFLALKLGLSDLVPWTLRKFSGSTLIAQGIKDLAEKLAKNHQLPLEIAVWSVETWAESVGIPFSPSPVTHPKTVPTNNTEVSYTEPTSRLGVLYGLDVQNSIRVFKVWWKSPLPQETQDLCAISVKRETSLTKPIVSSNSKCHTTSGVNSISSQPPSLASKNNSKPQSEKESLRSIDKTTYEEKPNPAATIPAKQGTTGGKKTLLRPIATPSFSQVADQHYNQALALLETSHGKSNIKEVVAEFVKAANAGHLLAEYRIGEIYLRGFFVQENFDVAFKWFESAAKKGYAEAQLELGSMYQCGIGIELNLTEAHKWYEKAANQGNLEAKNLLSQMDNPNGGRS